MTTVADINNWINSIAPYDTMEEWDNSGFLVGDMQAPVRRCVLSLDATLAGLYRHAGQRIGAKRHCAYQRPHLF